MVSASDKAVCDYVNSLLLDVSFPAIDLPEVEPYQPQDSVINGQRLQATQDVFSMMQMGSCHQEAHMWLTVLSLLPLLKSLPDGSVKRYVLRQTQILMNDLGAQ